MSVFWLFVGSGYYPSGGMSDFVGSFVTLAEAQAQAEKTILEDDDYEPWAQIVEVEHNQVVNQWEHNDPDFYEFGRNVPLPLTWELKDLSAKDSE